MQLKPKNSYIEEFFIKLNRLEPTEIYGVGIILGVNLLDETPIEDLIVEMAAKLQNLSRKKRRELFKIMDAASKRSKN